MAGGSVVAPVVRRLSSNVAGFGSPVWGRRSECGEWRCPWCSEFCFVVMSLPSSQGARVAASVVIEPPGVVSSCPVGPVEEVGVVAADAALVDARRSDALGSGAVVSSPFVAVVPVVVAAVASASGEHFQKSPL